jgi:hypothetical protein
MSTLVTGSIRSNTLNPPLFQDTFGTEIGTLCRAWVNFNGTGTVAIRASGNVSSITDNGTGNYTVNFATALADANYSGVAQCSDRSTVYGTPLVTRISNQTSSNFTIFAEDPFTSGPTQYDVTFMNIAFFR